MSEIRIGNRSVGPGAPVFVIAEAGVNHNGDLDMARTLVRIAAQHQADAVKFQTFKADDLAVRGAPKAKYQIASTGSTETQHDMLRRLELDREMHVQLIDECARAGIMFLSTPFDEESAQLLDDLGVAAFKVPSGEITNLPLLDFIARKNKPMLVSTGMANLEEVRAAVDTIRTAGNESIVLLQCVSNYPADPADVNLRAMDTMADTFGLRVGYSDHTTGIDIATAAVARGACVLEKHFTTDRRLPGPDHAASLEPAELAEMIRSIRRIEAALGDGVKRPAKSEMDTAAVARKSLVAATDLPEGTVLSRKDVAILRPGTGLSPALLRQILGRTLRVRVGAGTQLVMEMFV